MHGNAVMAALGMLAHMPWYHYLVLVVAVAAFGIAVHVRIRRTYQPRHGTVGRRDAAEHLAILVAAEFMAVVLTTVVVSGGMVAYHMVLPV